jgi:hypothetical protein
MWGLDSLALPINPDGTVTLPLWAAAIAAVLLLVLFVLALIRTGLAGTLVFIALVGFGVWGALAWSDHERVGERRALEQRLAAVETHAILPGSALGCLDAAGDTIEAACEHTIFANPETAAAAVSFTGGRLMLLQDAVGFASRRDPAFEPALDALRRTLESDRFGVVAQVLTVRNGCTAERCEPLSLLRDATRVRANMRDRTFETNVSRYAAAWPARATAAAASPSQNGLGTIPGTVAAPLPPRYTLPSAASIPPVSIMNNEPATPTPPAASAGTQSPAAGVSPPAPARRPPQPRSQATTPPIQLAPAPARP